MNIVQELATWAKKVPQWQSDAVRRIFTQADLSTDDHDELLRMLLAAHGIREDDQPILVPTPFSDVISDAVGEPKRILLKEIHSVSGVNALVPEQSITFALDGLTIIYGENGAGKSGYARVFKHACHAREKSEPIRNNVAAKKKEKIQATIELSVNDDAVAIQWSAGTPTSDLLAEIAVFDSHCARVFLDDANEVVYLPYGMDVFGRLAALCKSLKARIQEKRAAIPAAFASIEQFRVGTTAQAFVKSLSDKSDIAHLEKMVSLSATEKARLETLKPLVATARSNQPKQRAAELRRKKQRIEQVRTKLAAIVAGLAESVVTHLRALVVAAATASEAARIASVEAFKTDPLPGTGKDPWRLLFDAAKAFSEQAAYPDEEFPVVRDGALCLWCQQPLSAAASNRLNRFQQFVIDDVATKKASADSALAVAKKKVDDLNVQPFVADETVLEELRAYKDCLATAAEACVKTAKERKDALLKALTDHLWEDVPALPPSIEADLKTAVDSLEAEAAELTAADNPEALKKLQDELVELEDRELLGKQEKEVRAYIASKKREAALLQCEKECDTTSITKFGSKLMEKTVTDQLIAALKRETTFFGVKCVPLDIAKKGREGETKHQLVIASGIPPSGVLSEGEQRVVAIAAFLAELDTAGRNLPIIFDDPVSSLDHLFRERVAKRLVQEAKSKRQVVVFTHDIVMLLALERECGEQSASLLVHTVRRSSQGPGECPHPPSRPWHASSTTERIGFLKQASAGFKKLSQTPEPYRIAVAGVYGKLREAWERAIEEWLLNDAVQRFRPSIETQRLSRVTVDAADCAAIEKGMSRCSTHLTGHDSSGAISSPSPTPENIAEDIQQLETFVKTIDKRRKAAGVAVAALTEPPKPTLGSGRASTVIELAQSSPPANT